MNRIALLAAGAVAVLSLAACDHPDAARQRAQRSLKVVSKLDCPETQGSLTRVSVAADGLSCAYKGPDESEVTLKLVALDGGDAARALAPVEAELKALMPKGGPDKEKLDAADPAAEGVDIELPGVKIKAGDAGAKIDVGGAKIDATEEGAEVRVMRNVEIDGKTVESETHRRKGRRDDDVYARYILASDQAVGDWRAVGYEAVGPKGGPLVVGTVKVKGRGDHEDLLDDITDLIRHNVGGKKRRSQIQID